MFMYEDINNKLASLYQGMQNYKKSEEILVDLRNQLFEVNRKEVKYAVQLDLELEDVEQLNKKGFTSLIYSLIGSKEDKELKEKQEVIEAQSKLDEVRQQKEDINHRITVLQGEKQKYSTCEREYNELYKEKYDILKRNTTEYQQIFDLEASLTICKNNMKELDEAISSGVLVLDRLLDAESSLNSASGWGTWDLLGGGLISDFAKHSHIDNAKAAIVDVEKLLTEFRSELADIEMNTTITIDITGFTKFADFFFDGIIADWIVQSRIKDSLNSVLQAKSNVDEILIRLKQMQSSEENKISYIKQQINRYIMEV